MTELKIGHEQVIADGFAKLCARPIELIKTPIACMDTLTVGCQVLADAAVAIQMAFGVINKTRNELRVRHKYNVADVYAKAGMFNDWEKKT